MPTFCFVQHCKSVKPSKQPLVPGLSFHQFLAEGNPFRESWILFSQRDRLPSKDDVICGKHFRDDDFMYKSYDNGHKTLYKRNLLKNTAVPTLFGPEELIKTDDQNGTDWLLPEPETEMEYSEGRAADLSDLEEELYLWIQQEQGKGIGMFYEDVLKKAEEIAQKRGLVMSAMIPNCESWVERFRLRRGFVLYRRFKRSISATSVRVPTVSKRVAESSEEPTTLFPAAVATEQFRFDESFIERLLAPLTALNDVPEVIDLPVEVKLEPDTPSMATNWPLVILFGDSHFQNCFYNNGIGSLIASKFQRRCDVLARGFNGYNTRLGRCALDHVLSSIRTDLIAAFVILFGSNDACSENDKSHVSMQEYSDNLDYMLHKLKEYGIPPDRVILVSPPPSYQALWTQACRVVKRKASKRSNVTIETYALTAGLVATNHGAHFADLFSTMFTDSDWISYLLDGLHLNAQGAQKMYSVVGPLLEMILQPYGVLLPDWKEINPADVKETTPVASETDRRISTITGFPMEATGSLTLWPQVVLFGDSHFENCTTDNGIGALIATKFQRRCDVVKRGFGGYNTILARHALDCVLSTLSRERIAAFVILFGSNDVFPKGDRRHVELQKYADNLRYLVRKLKEHGILPDRIILLSPPPSNHVAWNQNCKRTGGRAASVRDNTTIEKYALSAGNVAQEQGVCFADLFSDIIKTTGWPSLFVDAVLLNSQGAKRMFGVLETFLGENLLLCKSILPDWKNVNLISPEADFAACSVSAAV